MQANKLLSYLIDSPYLFSKVIKECFTHLLVQALSFSMFIDDGLLKAKPDIIESHKQIVLDTCHDLCLVINWEKYI